MTDDAIPQDFEDSEIIADPLYRLIPISMFEKRLIGSPEFQRLRNIKQLGFASLVYPAAEHSRFVHSVGVCHQAKLMVDRVNDNMSSDPRYPQYRLYGEYHAARSDKVRKAGLPLISRHERIVISAAALLHDLPHAAFSHEIEGARKRSGPNVGDEIIPAHDNLAKNPTLFLYMFSRRSTLASIIRLHNADFYRSLLDYYSELSKPSSEDEDFLLFLREVVTHDGLVPLKELKKANELEQPEEQLTSPDSVLTVGNGSITDLRASLGVTEGAPLGLPLLGVMMFEIHLFEKQRQWLTSPEERHRLFGEKQKEGPLDPARVCFSCNGTQQPKPLQWLPLPGWFRAYRKDIIGNTICADLIDYVKRDGYHSGIVSEIDLKFLDRMFIARKVLPQDKAKTEHTGSKQGKVFEYASVPRTCEHIVFDVWDHKRGCHRHSVFTEMLAYLQARYLLCERVYTHRVVEGARVMLQEIVSLLDEASMSPGFSECSLGLPTLHPSIYQNNKPLQPDGDLALLKWVLCTCDSMTPANGEHMPDSLLKAQELAKMLEDRRVFREGAIVDGIHGLVDVPQEGEEFACRSLEQAFIPEPGDQEHYAEVLSLLNDIEDELREALNPQLGSVCQELPGTMAVIGIRKWAKKYKQPLVLVGRPAIRTNEGSPLNVSPLCDCEDPDNIRKQLEAMQDSFNALWRVYLFVHPVFHLKTGSAGDGGSGFGGSLQQASSLFVEFARKRTNWSWQNSIVELDNLLPAKPLDIPSYVMYMETAEPGASHDNARVKRYDAYAEEMYQQLAAVDREKEDTDPLTDREKITSYRDRLKDEMSNDIQLMEWCGSGKSVALKKRKAFRNAVENSWPEVDGRVAARYDEAFYLRILRAAKGVLMAQQSTPSKGLFGSD